MQQLYDFADQNNVTAIGGYHQTIGIGYFLVSFGETVMNRLLLTILQGGGHSILSPVYGLGVDRVVGLSPGNIGCPLE